MTQYPSAEPPFPGKEWILDRIEEKLDGRGDLGMGEHVSAFEREFADYVGRTHGVATDSGTAALEATLRALEVEGEEVIVPVQTFIATGSAVVTAGARPVFADIDPGHFCLSLDSVRDHLGPDTAAVIVVHFGGFVPPEIEELRALCDRHDVALIEDAAHAHGAVRNGTKAGAFGHAGCFSFYATKNMTTGEGGMIVTDDDDLAERAASIRNRGVDGDADPVRYSNLGSNYRMSEIAAIMGRSQLDHLDGFVDRRNAVAAVYDRELADLFDRGVLARVGYDPDPDVRHAYWRYTVVLPEDVDRERVRDAAQQADVPVDAAYPPLHLQPVFRDLYDTAEGTVPTAEAELSRHLCLPMHAALAEEDALAAAGTVADVLAERRLRP